MNETKSIFRLQAKNYLNSLERCFTDTIYDAIEQLAEDIRVAWCNGNQVFICGNGGSAANALHMANDFHYGIGACGKGKKVPGLRVDAMPSNQGVITCLANDIGYENIYSHQLRVKGQENDLLIVLSGSGNSPNVVNALQISKQLGIKSYAILAFEGGKCLQLADTPIHFKISDMQIAEDTQLIIGHICMQWLSSNKPE